MPLNSSHEIPRTNVIGCICFNFHMFLPRREHDLKLFPVMSSLCKWESVDFTEAESALTTFVANLFAGSKSEKNHTRLGKAWLKTFSTFSYLLTKVSEYVQVPGTRQIQKGWNSINFQPFLSLSKHDTGHSDDTNTDWWIPTNEKVWIACVGIRMLNNIVWYIWYGLLPVKRAYNLHNNYVIILITYA